MDEISDVRICPLTDSGVWGVRCQFKDGRVHVDTAGSLADAMASASRLRPPLVLQVIQGGRPDPAAAVVAMPKDRLSLIVK
jgi:hypothetical protein